MQLHHIMSTEEKGNVNIIENILLALYNIICIKLTKSVKYGIFIIVKFLNN